MHDNTLHEYLERPERRRLEAVVQKHYRYVWNIAYRVSGDREDAWDICQDVFLKLLLNPPQPQAVRSPNGFFAFRVVSRLEHMRRQARRRVAREKAQARRVATGGGCPETDAQDLRDAIARLPEDLRVAIELCGLAGLERREVGSLLGISPQAVGQRIQRAKTLLGRRLPLATGVFLAGHATVNAAPAELLPALLAISRSGSALTAASTAIAQTTTQGVVFMGSKKTVGVGIAAVALLLGGLTFVIAPRFFDDEPLQIAEPAPAPPDSPTEANVFPPGPPSRRITPEPRAVGVEVELPQEVALGGVVTDAGDDPISDARVVVVPLSEWTAVEEDWTRSVVFPHIDVARHLAALRSAFLERAVDLSETRSEPNGRYTFSELPPGRYRVVVSHPSFVPNLDTLAVVEASGPARCDVQLEAGARIQGRVVDTKGRPVRGAVVAAASTEDTLDGGVGTLGNLTASWRRGELLVQQKATTDAAGRFRLTSLAPGDYSLRASAKGFVKAGHFGVGTGTDEVMLTLKPGASVVGRVLDPSEQAIAEASVTLQRRSGREVLQYFSLGATSLEAEGVVHTSTNNEGLFRAIGLETGTYELRVTAAGFPTWRREVTITTDAQDLGELKLKTGRFVTGRVIDVERRAVPGARVWVRETPTKTSVYDLRLIADPEPLVATETRADGQFRLEDVPSSAFEVCADADGFVKTMSTVGLSGGQGMTLILSTGLSVNGLVLDGDTSKPIAGAAVYVGGRGEASTVSNDAGRFVVRGVPPSEHEAVLRIFKDGYVPYSQTRFSPHGRIPASPAVIRLSPCRRVRGQVVDAEGQPVAGVRLRLDAIRSSVGYDTSASVDGFSGSDGRFSLPEPPPSPYPMTETQLVLNGRHASGAGRVGPIATPQVGESWPDITLALHPLIAFEGRVSDSTGGAVAGATVEVTERVEAMGTSREVSPTKRSVRTRDDGSFRVVGVMPGTVQVRVAKRGYSRESLEWVLSVNGARADFVLESGRSLEGTVVDSEGTPIVGAVVVAQKAAAGENNGLSPFERRLARLRGLGVSWAVTAARGRFELDSLPDEAVILVARRAGYEAAEVQVESEFEDVNLVLERFSAVYGRVTSGGVPVRVFEVDVIDRQAGASEEEWKASRGRLDFQHPDGTYLYDGLVPGKYRLLADAEGYAPFRQEFSVSANEATRIDVELRRGEVYRGVVLDLETNEPIAGAQVWSRKRGGDGDKATSGVDGRFELSGVLGLGLEGVLAGRYSFRVQHPLYRFVDPEKNTHAGEPEDSTEIELRLTPYGRIEGHVYGIRQGPDQFVSYTILCERIAEDEGGEGQVFRFPAQHDGFYATFALKPGTYRVALERQRAELDEPEFYGAGGVSQAYVPLGEPETLQSQSVQVRARETTGLDFGVGRGN